MSTYQSRISARRSEAEPVTVVGAGPACAIALHLERKAARQPTKSKP